MQRWWCYNGGGGAATKREPEREPHLLLRRSIWLIFFKKAFHPFGAKHTHAHKHSEHLAGNRERARESAKAAQSKYMVNGNRLEDHPAPTN